MVRDPINPIDVLVLRTRLGLTQQQFAKKLDVDNMTVSRWERSGKAPTKGENARKLRELEASSWLADKPPETLVLLKEMVGQIERINQKLFEVNSRLEMLEKKENPGLPETGTR